MAGLLIKRFLPLIGENTSLFHTSACLVAARKGTREKARKKKVKVELKKIGFIPHNERGKERLRLLSKSKRSVETNTEDPIDRVYATDMFRTVTYPISQAIQFHREANHPSVYNKPAAPVSLTIELNMVAEKKTRFMDAFNRIVDIPHPFGTHDDRTVLAFCKTPEQVQQAVDAGADLAGGTELVQRIQNGDLALHEFRFVVCHPSMLAELVPIRGLLKRKFPQAKAGSLGPDMKVMLRKFKLGLQYRCEKDEFEHDLGIITTAIGSLDMATEQLEENFVALVRDIEEARPKRGGDFITWAWCFANPSPERIKVGFEQYIATKTES